MTPSARFPAGLWPVNTPWKHPTTEYCPDRRRWIQDGRTLYSGKSSKAFVWPKDGRNGTTWGRFKDILTNKGPDIYLTMNANKLDYMDNRPRRAHWSGHPHLDEGGFGNDIYLSSRKFAPWTQKAFLGGRMPGFSYDFRTREYGSPNRRMWTDVRWQPEPRKHKHNVYPEAVRDIHGDWYQDAHYLPQWVGGPVNNERGYGMPGLHHYVPHY